MFNVFILVFSRVPESGKKICYRIQGRKPKQLLSQMSRQETSTCSKFSPNHTFVRVQVWWKHNDNVKNAVRFHSDGRDSLGQREKFSDPPFIPQISTSHQVLDHPSSFNVNLLRLLRKGLTLDNLNHVPQLSWLSFVICQQLFLNLTGNFPIPPISTSWR